MELVNDDRNCVCVPMMDVENVSIRGDFNKIAPVRSQIVDSVEVLPILEAGL